jgi:hypothetical protein
MPASVHFNWVQHSSGFQIDVAPLMGVQISPISANIVLLNTARAVFDLPPTSNRKRLWPELVEVEGYSDFSRAIPQDGAAKAHDEARREAGQSPSAIHRVRFLSAVEPATAVSC